MFVCENIKLGDNIFEFPHELLSDIPFALSEHIDDINRTLSTGQKQRICFLRSLQANSPFIFFDETLSGCQAELVEKCIEYAINRTKSSKSGQKIVMVLHNFSMSLQDIGKLNLTEVKPN